MNFSSNFLFVTLIYLSLFSCKNEVKDDTGNEAKSPSSSMVDATPVGSRTTIEVDSEVRNVIVNSIMLKSMITPELKTFSSMIVSAELADLLSKEKGPFTLIGPSNDAFKSSLGQIEMKDLLNAANKDGLVRLVQSHVFKGDLDKVNLGRKIKEGRGSFQIVSMSGSSYTVSRKGEDILFTDQNGVSAQILKGDIKAINGVVHTIDRVFEVIN